jgi:CubicO group peptidase (beta-lactamase class C family)
MSFPNATNVGLAVALVALAPTAARPQQSLDPDGLVSIPARVNQFVDQGLISGAVMLLARQGEVVLHEAVGYRNIENQEKMRTDTVFQVQSMTKPVTAVGIMILVEGGRLRLNDPVEKHLPEFRGQTLARNSDGDDQPRMQQPTRPITIRDLLTHTSGMPHGHHAYTTAPTARTLEAVVVSNAGRPLETEPGATFRYSNLGFETLGRIIEVVSGRSYREFVQERIFHPLGMESSFFIAQPGQCARVATIYELTDGNLTRFDGDPCRPFTYPNPAGGMFSTAADMFAFYQMTLEGGSYRGMRILSRASVEAMTAPLVSVPPGGPISGFGLGWWVVREPVGMIGLPRQSRGSYGHAGYWGTIGWVDPRTGLVGVFLLHYNSTATTGRGTHVRAYAEVFIAMATAALVPDHHDHKVPADG